MLPSACAQRGKMSNGRTDPKPLPVVLEDLALVYPRLVLIKGPEYFRIEDLVKHARKDASSGPARAKKVLAESRFWWEKDPAGKVIVIEMAPEGAVPFLIEVGSQVMASGL